METIQEYIQYIIKEAENADNNIEQDKKIILSILDAKISSVKDLKLDYPNDNFLFDENRKGEDTKILNIFKNLVKITLLFKGKEIKYKYMNLYLIHTYKLYQIFINHICKIKPTEKLKEKDIKEQLDKGYKLLKDLFNNLNTFFDWLSKNPDINMSIDEKTSKEVQGIKKEIQEIYKDESEGIDRLNKLRKKYPNLKDIWDKVEKNYNAKYKK